MRLNLPIEAKTRRKAHARLQKNAAPDGRGANHAK